MRNMTEGNVTRHMISYSIPLLAGNILQQLYNTADTIIVGRFAGKTALAAVGTAAPVMNILTFLMIGITMGTSVLMAQFFGGDRLEELKKEEVTSLLSGSAFTILLSLLSLLLIDRMLGLIKTPDLIMPEAKTYLHIIIYGLIFSFLYNLSSSALRAIGDSKTPLFFLTFSSILNILLSILFVKHLKLGVAGAAYGTVISQFISALLCFIYICRKVPILRFTLKDLSIDMKLLAKTAYYGSISGIQQTFLYVGIFILQGAVNQAGVNAIAAYNAATKIDGFILAPTDSLAMALTTFISQNRGAGKIDRMGQGLSNSMVIGSIYCIGVSIITYLTATHLMGLFMDSEETNAIAVGASYLKTMALFYILPAFCNSFQGFFRGLGRMDITLYATVIQIPVRLVVAYLLVGHMGIRGIALGVITGWFFMIAYEGYETLKGKREALATGEI